MLEKVFQGPLDEIEATRMSKGSVFERVWLGLQSGMRLARDPCDTKQVFYLGIALDRERLARIYDKLAAHSEGRELLRDRPSIESRSVDFAQLRALPPDSLGGAYARSLVANGLDPDFFQRPPALPDDHAFVGQRVRQTHDIWHVLTGLHTDIPGEIALQAFSFAQMGTRFSAMIVLFGTLFYGLRYPRTLGMVRHWYRVGRKVPYLLAVRWEDLWAEPLASVRARYGLADAVQPS